MAMSCEGLDSIKWKAAESKSKQLSNKKQ